jgi:hypothetical protein
MSEKDNNSATQELFSDNGSTRFHVQLKDQTVLVSLSAAHKPLTPIV